VFSLDPAFLTSSEALTTLDLCEVRLQSDARFPWLILVPRVAGVRELDDLAPAARLAFLDEILLASAAVRAMGAARGRPVDKLNIGLLGNITPQLHVHVVGRRVDDPAWPGPVWGYGASLPYPPDAARAVATAALGVLGRP
jgi:diadenosine tetraphosphate (Ap4A) HIT family hydrolase